MASHGPPRWYEITACLVEIIVDFPQSSTSNIFHNACVWHNCTKSDESLYFTFLARKSKITCWMTLLSIIYCVSCHNKREICHVWKLGREIILYSYFFNKVIDRVTNKVVFESNFTTSCTVSERLSNGIKFERFWSLSFSSLSYLLNKYM